jgi:hypothetical protein
MNSNIKEQKGSLGSEKPGNPFSIWTEAEVDYSSTVFDKPGHISSS